MIALLTAGVSVWIVEFFLQIIAFDHRVAAWLSATFALHAEAWLVTSAVRTIVAGLTCLAMYAYLSPERFDK